MIYRNITTINLILIVLALLGFAPCFAQHEADKWYFGDNAGLTFETGKPSILMDGKVSTLEGCATISNKKTGDLLFYTDGMTVWNANHSIMPNGTGLEGTYGATQGALIVPNPSDSLQYYIFTVPAWESGKMMLYYSIVSLKSSVGEVILKNQFLADSVSEKLTGTIDCSGTGYWILTHHRRSAAFYSFHLTPNGLNRTPQISTYDSSDLDFTVGQMKISPDNSKIALAATSKLSYLTLFDFDPASGLVSNYRILSNRNINNSIYGLSFSPNSTKLYVTAGKILFFPEITTGISFLLQYEVNLPTLTAIRNSGIAFQTADLTYSGLQLGPDGKLYMARSGWNLDVINNPDMKGSACKYQQSVLKISGKCNFGLPNFMDYLFCNTGEVFGQNSGCKRPVARTESISGCIGTPLLFTDKSTYKPISREWTFDDGTPSVSTKSSVTVTYSQEGNHRVRLIVTNERGSDTTYTFATIVPFPKAIAGNDITVCQGASSTLGALPEEGNKYSWLPVTNLDNPTISNPKCTPVTMDTLEYILTVKNSTGCTAYDTVKVSVGTIHASVSQNVSICKGLSTQLVASGGSEYIWTPSDGLDNSRTPSPFASPDSTTTYKVMVSSGPCQDSAFVTVTVNPHPPADAGPDLSYCKGEPIQLGTLPQEGNKYQWLPTSGLDDPSKSNPLANPKETTNYILTVTNNSGCQTKDSILVTEGFIHVTVFGDTTVCKGSSVPLFASGGTEYHWSPGLGLDDSTVATPIATPNSTTKYKVIVTNGFCKDSDFVTVTVLPQPIAHAGIDKVICDGNQVQIGSPSISGNTYYWTPTVGLSNSFISNPIAFPKSTTEYRLVVSNGLCSDSSSVRVSVAEPPIATAGDDKVICFGEKVSIGTTSIAGDSYSWIPTDGLSNPNESLTIASPTSTTTYILTKANLAGCIDTDTITVTVKPLNEQLFTLSPSKVTILPGQPFQTYLHIPNGVTSWRVHLNYENSVAKFSSIAQTSLGISVNQTDSNGELFISGIEGNGTILINFNTFLPQNSDTTFEMILTVDSVGNGTCQDTKAIGTTLQLGVFCGRNIRNVSSTGKKYYLTTKENGINFGVGLAGNVRVELYDYTGTLKEVLMDGTLEAGEYSVDFDLNTGVYFCRMSAGIFNDVQKIMILQSK